MKEVLNFIKYNIDFFESPNIVVAVSGGPDSMVLLNVLMNMRKNYNFKIICAHVNHNVREESENEKKFLKKYCIDNEIVFEYMKIENYNKENFQEQARKIRYNFFEKILKKYDSKYLFTAHHGDDLIETILMRITRGSNLKGYSGFSLISNRNNYKIVRPLTYLTKQEIKDYAINNNIPFVIDKSNEKECYTRNRYRKHILPFLKKEEKNIHKKYLKFSRELLKYDSYVNKVVQKEYLNVTKNNEIYLDKFILLDILLQEKIIEKFLSNIYMENLSLIKSVHIENIIKICHSKNANLFVDLPNNIRISKKYNILSIDTKKEKDKIYKIKLSDKVILNSNEIIEIVKNSDDTSNYCIRLNSNEIKLPLYVRNKLKGDKIYIKGLDGRKKIKDIFINEKIDRDKRKTFPLLIDSNNEILWIPGLKKSKYDKSKCEKYDIIVRYKFKEEEKHEEK